MLGSAGRTRSPVGQDGLPLFTIYITTDLKSNNMFQESEQRKTKKFSGGIYMNIKKDLLFSTDWSTVTNNKIKKLISIGT